MQSSLCAFCSYLKTVYHILVAKSNALKKNKKTEKQLGLGMVFK